MESQKRRKREVAYSRITYDTATRTFDRLFKEDSLEEMKEVVREKLGITSSIAVHLSQFRDGKSVDLEDDKDFEAFRLCARDTSTLQVKVVLGSNAPASKSHTDPETTASSTKKKRRKPDASSSPTLTTKSTVRPSQQKKRRVSFASPPFDPQTEASQSPGTQHNSLVETDVSERKKKKHKHKEVSVDVPQARERALGRAIPVGTSKKRSRSREQSSSSLADNDVEIEGDLPSRPAKKIKFKTVEGPLPPRESRATSVPPPSIDIAAAPPVKERKPQTKKSSSRALSEPPSAADFRLLTSDLVGREGADQEKPRKKKAKTKGDPVLDSEPSGKQSKTAAGTKDAPPISSGNKNGSSPSLLSIEIGKKTSQRRSRDVREKAAESPSLVVEAKASTKKRKKMESMVDETGPTRGDESTKIDLIAATAAAVQAILMRKGIATSVSEVAASNNLRTPVIGEKDARGPAQNPKKDLTSTIRNTEVDQSPEACSICDGFPNHDSPLCPVIKGGVRTMRKRVVELEKFLSEGDEERNRVLADLRERIQKRSRKPRVKTAVDNPTPHEMRAAKSAKQVEVVSPPTSVVNIDPPAAAEGAGTKKSFAEQLIDSNPKVGRTDLGSWRNLSRLSDLSHVTDKDLKRLVSGPKISIADVPSSNEDEDEGPDQAEPALDDEDEMSDKISRRLSQNISHLAYPLSSEAEEESESMLAATKPNSKVVKSSEAAKELADAVNRSTGANKVSTPKAKTSAKIVAIDPVQPSPKDGSAIEEGIPTGSQWAILQESNPLTETPGQLDELLSPAGTNVGTSPEISSTKAIVNGSARRAPLFLPGTQQTPLGGSQKTNGGRDPSAHDSEDVSDTAEKKTQRKYRALSQFAGSNTFLRPQFPVAKSRKVQEPVRVPDEDDDDSDSGSESSQVESHIPASRRAGLGASKKR